MARISKQRGYSLEKKIVDWFNNAEKRSDWPSGWEAERNALSKTETSFGVTTAKHDVKARKRLPNGSMIFLQIEAKKTGKDFHTIQWKWIEKIDFAKDEFLAIAFARTPEYVVMEADVYLRMPKAKQSILTEKIDSYSGEACFRIHASTVLDVKWDSPYCFEVSEYKRKFVAVPLVEYVAIRETLPPTFTADQAKAMLGQESVCKAEAQHETPQLTKPPTEIQSVATIVCPHCKNNLQIKIVGDQK